MFRPIYEPRTRAKEYCDLAINIYKGCNHGCEYCYARKMAERYTSKDCICSFNEPKLRQGIVEATKNQLSGGKYKGKKILLCFMCDPYPADIDTMPTREIITAIKNAGANFAVLTKGGMRAVRDFDLYEEGDSFGTTLTFRYPFDSLKWEPKAALPEERFEAIKKANIIYNIKTWISLEPVINPIDTLDMVNMLHSYVDLWKVGRWNYDVRANLIDWKGFGEDIETIFKRYDCNYYIKDDLRKEMEVSP
jgi:DNA repair photolyase